MTYPTVCAGCVYRGEEMHSDCLVCQNPYIGGPKRGECDEWISADDLFGIDESDDGQPPAQEEEIAG